MTVLHHPTAFASGRIPRSMAAANKGRQRMIRVWRAVLASGLFAAAVAAAVPAAAQNYPARPVSMIVPFPPGGNTDIMARALQNELGKALGQTVVIVNKGGAAGSIGINELVKSQPDGYTVALTQIGRAHV